MISMMTFVQFQAKYSGTGRPWKVTDKIASVNMTQKVTKIALLYHRNTLKGRSARNSSLSNNKMLKNTIKNKGKNKIKILNHCKSTSQGVLVTARNPFKTTKSQSLTYWARKSFVTAKRQNVLNFTVTVLESIKLVMAAIV